MIYFKDGEVLKKIEGDITNFTLSMKDAGEAASLFADEIHKTFLTLYGQKAMINESNGVQTMPVQIKQKQVAQPKSIAEKKQKAKVGGYAESVGGMKALTEEQIADLDEFVQLKRDLDEMMVKEKLKSAETIRKELQSIAKEFPPSERVVLKGTLGEVAFKEASDVRKITDVKGLIAALKAAIGMEGLLSMINVSLVEAEKYLGAVELEKYVTHTTDSRTLDGYTLYEKP